MARNTSFQDDKHPMRHHSSLELNHDKIHGPVRFLNPTQAHYNHVHQLTTEEKDSDSDKQPVKETSQPAQEVSFKWTSRNDRKGRHALVVKPTSASDPTASYDVPTSTRSVKHILTVCWWMLVKYPYWDVSWWVAWLFTVGSVVWVINGFFSFLPDVRPSSEFPDEVYVGGGVTAFIGATIFVIGSVLLMVEAVNENRSSCFGWAVERAWNGERHVLKIRPAMDKCEHHHQNRGNLVGSGRADVSKQLQDMRAGWTWVPSLKELKEHYIHNLGFLACLVQLYAASVFWISGWTALPGIYDRLDTTASLDGAYWSPQVAGGLGFVVSGTLFMLETQKHWYLPAFNVLGWHIGMWNTIGGWGFFLCPIFGYNTASWSQYQAACSTFWGSFAFLIGSLIQLYESLEKNPVEVDKSAGSTGSSGEQQD